MSKGTPSGKGAQGGGKRDKQTKQTCPRCGNTDDSSPCCLHSDKTCQIWRVCRSSGTPQPKVNGAGRHGHSHSQNELELWREWVLVIPVTQLQGPCGGEDLTKFSQLASQDTTMSEWILEPRGAAEENCPVGVPSRAKVSFLT